MLNLRLILFFLSLILSTRAWSNDCGPYLDNFLAPVCTKARYILLVGSGMTYIAHQSEQTANRDWRIKLNKNKPLGAFGQVGEALGWGWPTYMYVGYQLTRAWVSKEDRRLENAELALEAFGYTVLATGIMKTLIHSQRPDGTSEWDSFPSGHSSSSFAWSSVVAARHEWYYGLAAYMTSAYIAFTRIHDNRHHFHDVMGGITLGLSYGWGIAFNHEQHQKPYWFTLLPTDDLQGAGLYAAMPF